VSYDTTNSLLPHNRVRSIVIDDMQNKWIGTDGGLVKIDGNTWTIYDKTNSAVFGGVTAIAIEKNKTKWIGSSGLVKFDINNGWSAYNHNANPGLPDDNVYAIAIDSNQNKWIGTDGGLVKFDNNTWTVYNKNNSGLPDNHVRAITIDKDQNIWIGLDYSGGLVKFDGIDWTIYNSSNSGLPANNIKSISIDSNQNKWIGVELGGLVKFDGNNWTVYNNTNSGLPCNAVYSIAIDSNLQKWIGSIGLAVFKEGGVSINEETDIKIPTISTLFQNYPNPFNNSTVISYQLANAGLVKLSVYNAKGEIVQNLVNTSQIAGTHNIQFNANGLNSGVYFYRLESVEKSLVGKMLLVK